MPKTDFPKPDVTDLHSAVLLGDHLIIQKWPPEEVTAGGIVIPDAQQQEKPDVAWVIKVSDDGFSVGDTVVYPSYAATPIPSLGDDICYIKAQDVLLRFPVHFFTKEA